MDIEQSEEPAAKRRRVTKACDQCSRRRRKCEGGTPACASCVAAGKANQCTYTKPAKRRGPLAGYSSVAKTASERLRLLSLVLGEALLRSPAIGDVFDVVNGRLHSSDLCPGPDRKPWSDDEKIAAWTASNLSQWLEEKMVDFGDGESTANGEARQVSEERTDASTSAAMIDVDEKEERDPRPLQNIQRQGSALSISSETMYDLSESSPGRLSGIATSSLSQLSPLRTATVFSPSLANFLNSAPLRSNSSQTYFGPSSSAHLFSKSTSPLPSLPPTVVPPLILTFDLPDERIINILLDTYLNGPCHWSFPFIDKQRLLTWSMDLHDTDNPSNHDARAASGVSLELAFAIFATALPHSSLGAGPFHDQSLSTDLFRAQAEHHLARAIQAPTLSTVQALVLLSLAEMSAGNLFSANSHLASGLALAVSMGMHQSASRCYTEREEEQVFFRRTFFALLVVDTLLALQMGRCPLLSKTSYDCSLPSAMGPEEVEIWRPTDVSSLRTRMGDMKSYTARPTSAGLVRSGSLSTFVELVRLCTIASDLLHRLNSPCHSATLSSSGVPDLGRTYAALSRWEASLASHFRPRDDRPSPMHKLELNLLFHTFVILCLRPHILCSSPEVPLDPMSLHHLNKGAEALCHLAEHSTLYESRPYLQSVVLTISSTLTFSGLSPRELSRYWAGTLEAACQLSVTYPAMKSSLEAIKGLPQAKQPPPITFSAPTHLPSNPAAQDVAMSGISNNGTEFNAEAWNRVVLSTRIEPVTGELDPIELPTVAPMAAMDTLVQTSPSATMGLELAG
ncbi:hypothetical protein T439DRAFT_168144 [Meredithblackwellia eburnea MCA 4105]